MECQDGNRSFIPFLGNGIQITINLRIILTRIQNSATCVFSGESACYFFNDTMCDAIRRIAMDVRLEHTGTVEVNERRLYEDGNQIPDEKPKKTINNHSSRCLVIDDEILVLYLVAEMVSVLGYRVDTASNRRDVISMLNTNSYDLIVTDLMMPDMDGYRLAIAVKRKLPSVKVVIMTGRDESECLEMRSDGADGWLFKPFGLNELIDKLGELGLSKPH